MEQVFNFINAHRELLASCFLAVVTLVLQLIKKKPVAYSYKDYLVECFTILPYWIENAEEIYGASSGPDKRQYVIDKAISFLESKVDITLKQRDSAVESVSYLIESILSTPQKKNID